MASYKIVSINSTTKSVTLDVTIGGNTRTWNFNLKDIPTDSITSFEAWLKDYIASFKSGLLADNVATPDTSVTAAVGTSRNIEG